LIFGLYQTSNYWCTRNEQFGRLAVSRISQSVGTISTQIGTGVLLGSNPAGLIIGRIIGQFIGTTVLWSRIIRKDLRVYLRSLSWVSMKSALYQYRNFPLYVAPYAFLSGFQHRAIYLLLGVFTTVRVVGWYALAMRLMYVPIGLVSASMNQVFYQKAAAAPKLKELEHFVVRILTLMVILVTPLLVFLLFSAHWLFGLVFGENWAEAGTYGIIMAFPAFMLLITSWLDKIYYVLERQRLALVMEVTYDIFSIGLFLLALIFLRTPEFAIGVYAITTIIYNIVWLAVTFNISGFTKKSLFKIGLSFLLVVICALVAYLGLNLIVDRTVTIIIYSGFLLIFYLTSFAMFRKRWITAYDNERKVEEVLAG
jgi:O-antigen/teichoic acid export membrane protein